MTNKYLATGPNGETFTRTSKSRAYTHTVVGRVSLEGARASARRQVANDVKSYNEHVIWARDGYTPAAWMNKPDYKADSGFATIADRHRAEGKASSQAWLAGKADTAEGYAADKLAATLAAIDAKAAEGFYDRFTVNFGWCGRPDLAAKLAASSAGAGYDEILILEAVAR